VKREKPIMISGKNIAPVPSAELLGDAHPLLEQLGSTEDLALTGSMVSALEFGSVKDLPTLRRFLDIYRAEILIPVELPAIVAAHGHATRGELRELLALEQKLAGEPAIRRFAQASCRVGQRQLGRLRPMRDQRVVQRYLAALEDGRARGWHTLVYGLSLAMFSLPLRQGLQNYAEQTLRGFTLGATRSLRLPASDGDTLLAEYFSAVPQAISGALAAQSPLRLS
jgi:urease accessory protein UreF